LGRPLAADPPTRGSVSLTPQCCRVLTLPYRVVCFHFTCFSGQLRLLSVRRVLRFAWSFFETGCKYLPLFTSLFLSFLASAKSKFAFFFPPPSPPPDKAPPQYFPLSSPRNQLLSFNPTAESEPPPVPLTGATRMLVLFESRAFANFVHGYSLFLFPLAPLVPPPPKGRRADYGLSRFPSFNVFFLKPFWQPSSIPPFFLWDTTRSCLFFLPHLFYFPPSFVVLYFLDLQIHEA